MSIQEFLEYWETKINELPNDELEKMYSLNWELRLDGKKVEIPFDATSYNALTAALERIKSEE